MQGVLSFYRGWIRLRGHWVRARLSPTLPLYQYPGLAWRKETELKVSSDGPRWTSKEPQLLLRPCGRKGGICSQSAPLAPSTVAQCPLHQRVCRPGHRGLELGAGVCPSVRARVGAGLLTGFSTNTSLSLCKLEGFPLLYNISHFLPEFLLYEGSKALMRRV